ncbi:MAG: dTDP-4-dehydrorhamnose reductase [Cyclobacteriaceae bacterium]
MANTKTILVTGSKGQLGNELQELAGSMKDAEFHFVDIEELDITDSQQVRIFFDEVKPTHCINCAAYTAVDKAESDRELCDLINVAGVENLASASKVHDAILYHISTDFVFNGHASQPLTEDQETDPVCYYGESKLNGEKKVAQVTEKHYIIRTSWLYSSFGNNFVKTMLRLGETKPELGVIFDQVGTPTYAKDLAESILKMIEAPEDHFGTYHYSNEGVASWYDFTKAIFEYENITIPVKPIPTTAYPTPAKRPHFSVMDKQKIKNNFNLTIPHWRESLKACLVRLQKP